VPGTILRRSDATSGSWTWDRQITFNRIQDWKPPRGNSDGWIQSTLSQYDRDPVCHKDLYGVSYWSHCASRICLILDHCFRVRVDWLLLLLSLRWHLPIVSFGIGKQWLWFVWQSKDDRIHVHVVICIHNIQIPCRSSRHQQCRRAISMDNINVGAQMIRQRTIRWQLGLSSSCTLDSYLARLQERKGATSSMYCNDIPCISLGNIVDTLNTS
jgi:hypothetical protein